MKENIAKHKWCPMYRGLHAETSPYDGSRCCITRDCMLWVITSRPGVPVIDRSGRCGLTNII